MLVALAGGVGAARFLRGLVEVIDRSDILVIGNTGDDDEFHGLHVSPDLDTVTYTLADAVHPEQGWGLGDDTFECMETLGTTYGVPTWFRLGDRDLATHLFRTHELRSGRTLTEVTRAIGRRWNIGVDLVPMSDDRVHTIVEATDGRELRMQEWFVREGTVPEVRRVRFDDAEGARPAPGVLDAIAGAERIVVCPSNPVLSIGPILAVPAIRRALAARRDRVVAVSPIVAGRALKGPADRVMAALGYAPTCVGVAQYYSEICATLVIDDRDAARRRAATQFVDNVVVTDTVMRDARVAAALARHTLAAVA